MGTAQQQNQTIAALLGIISLSGSLFMLTFAFDGWWSFPFGRVVGTVAAIVTLTCLFAVFRLMDDCGEELKVSLGVTVRWMLLMMLMSPVVLAFVAVCDRL